MDSVSRTSVAISAGVAAAAILVSLWLGQDINWDLRNYHYYDGWALLNGMIERDLWPAQQQTFFNPILPALTYLLISHLPPWAAASVLAGLQSVNVFLIAIIAGQVFPQLDSSGRAVGRTLAILAATLIGVTGAMMIAELGTTFGDNIASCFILAALAALGQFRRAGRLGWVVVAGLAAGMAAGLKLPNSCYLVGLVLCGWWFGAGMRAMAVRLFLFGVGAASGLGLVYGPWAWHLWRTKANPVFPFFNGVFRSPWRSFDSLRDERFLPHSFLDAVSYPFQWAIGRFPTSETYFRDARFACVWLLLLVWLGTKARTRPAASDDKFVDRAWLGTIALFWAVSFCIWITIFAYQRYLMSLEILSGVIILGVIAAIAGPALSIRPRRLAALAIVIILLATTRSDSWGRLDWDDDWFGIQLPPALQKPGQMFVILSGEPVAYVVPSFPPDTRFVRLGGNLPLQEGTGLYKAAKTAIVQHRGPLQSLEPDALRPWDKAILKQFGLRRDGDSCVVIATRFEQLRSCLLIPITGSGGS
jgi:hypothetical protein